MLHAATEGGAEWRRLLNRDACSVSTCERNVCTCTSDRCSAAADAVQGCLYPGQRRWQLQLARAATQMRATGGSTQAQARRIRLKAAMRAVL
jgi:hypothetical protein